MFEYVQNHIDLDGKTVLVTGGTGSFGTAFVNRVVSKFDVKKLIIFSRDEDKQYHMANNLRRSLSDNSFSRIRFFIGDVRDTDRLKLACNKVDILVHAAAMKHVEAAEYNPMECVKTNIIGAQNIVEASIHANVDRVIALSTDKAANPVNMMGASKRIMEMFLMRESLTHSVSMARFANVAFSDGSLLHGFNQRYAKRQPFSAPNDVQRYFITPQESGELCLLSALLGKNRDIFFPKLSKKLHLITFSEIAIHFLKERGYKANKQWPCYFFKSDTTGEKDFEEFFTDSESLDMNRFYTIGVIQNKPEFNGSKLDEFMDGIYALRAKATWTKDEIVRMFYVLLPEFEHKETGKYLDQRM